MLTLRAYAKVNLTLEVLRARPDGYHDIASVVQTVGLYDTLTFEGAPSLTVEGSPPDVRMEDDLVYRAARLLQDELNVKAGARIRLEKRIPVAAGLGGGSSDAAATLKGLVQLWGVRGVQMPGLHRLAAHLGSDVPFFLYGGTALIEGRGERVTPLPAPQGDLGLVLLHPPTTIPNKTASLYRALPPTACTKGGATTSLVDRLNGRPSPADRLSGHLTFIDILHGKVAPLAADSLFNVFDTVAFDNFPGLEKYWHLLEAAGAPCVHLAGTGPTLYTLAGWEQAEKIYHRLQGAGYDTYVVRMIAPGGRTVRNPLWRWSIPWTTSGPRG